MVGPKASGASATPGSSTCGSASGTFKKKERTDTAERVDELAIEYFPEWNSADRRIRVGHDCLNEELAKVVNSQEEGETLRFPRNQMKKMRVKYATGEVLEAVVVEGAHRPEPYNPSRPPKKT